MNLTLDDVREILEKEYHRENLIFLFEKLFCDFRQSNAEIGISSKFKRCQQIGYSDSCEIKIYEVLLTKEIENQRVGITKEMFKILKDLNEYNAIVLFVNENQQNYRLSLLTTSIVSNGENIKKEYSNPRRYSYYLGVGTKTKTVYDLLYAKDSVNSLDELKDRFSIDIVNKDFYSKIADAFTKLVGNSFDKNKYNGCLVLPNKVNKKKYSEFGVRLLGRLIFCWFLKEKKSEKGLSLIPEILFDDKMVIESSNYYNDILQTLFFETLNTPWENRKDLSNKEYFKHIPYLNGGLFSPHTDDFYDGIGCQNVFIPNRWFLELFQVLRQYNFTVDESTSYDVELSIDPEMLGRIFENLLADINPETGKSSRNSTGSFYTPRDIVEFMVNTSLYEHLVNTTQIEPSKIEKLVQYDDSEDNHLTDTERKKIVDSLYEIKILDPACGSGAFPMGLLQKIVYILQKIDSDNLLWFEKIEKDKSIDEETKKEIKLSSADYMRKLLVVKNSIYGVDLQPIAVEISRLRCFLSIIIEEKVDEDQYNRGIRPLPNLDFNFAIGNTLVPLEKEGESMSLFDDYDLISELNKVRSKWFSADSKERANLRQQISYIQSEMFDSTTLFPAMSSQKYQRLIDWHPYTTDENPWFDSEWMFGVEKFDIVIGNPPYIRLQNRLNIDDPSDTTKLGDLYKNSDYKTFNRMGDIYCLFYEKGMDLLKDNGILTFITSNKWMRSPYGESLRKFLGDYNPLILLDSSGEKFFNAATVDVNILVCKKTSNSHATYCCEMAKNCRDNLSEYVKKKCICRSFNSSSNWIVSDDLTYDIKSKIDSIGVPMKNWNISINYGIKTGLNEAFIITKEERDKLVAEDSKSDEIIKPLLRGRDVKRYGIEFENSWLIYVPWHFPLQNDSSISGPSEYAEKLFKDNYPAIYGHLIKFKDKLERRNVSEVGIRYEWYALQRYGAKYWEDFYQPKIMCGFIAKRLSFCYLEDTTFCLNPAFFISAGKYNKYVLACLNSNLIDWYYKVIGEQIGSKNIIMLADTLEKIPLPLISDSKLNEFDSIVDEINIFGVTDEKLKKINDMVEELYDLNDEEKEYISFCYDEN